MKVTLFMAMSLNGMIARPDDTEDFLSNYGWTKFMQLAHQHRCVIWGRRTYEVVKQNYADELSSLESITKVVVSREPIALGEGFVHANSPENALAKLAELGFDSALLSGGAKMNSAFAQMNLIDEIIVNVEPVIVGQGVSLFAQAAFDLELKLVETDTYEESGITLKYEVIKE